MRVGKVPSSTVKTMEEIGLEAEDEVSVTRKVLLTGWEVVL